MTFYGYTDSMSPAQKALVEKRLTTHGRYTGVSYHGKQYSYPEYIRLLIKQGGDFISRKESSGKTVYGLYVDVEVPCPTGGVQSLTAKDRRAYEVLTKTQYDFAVYLRENHFDDDAVAQAFETEEKERIAREATAQVEREEAERYEEEAEHARREDFERLLIEKTQEIFDAHPEVYVAVHDLFMNKIGGYRSNNGKVVGAISLMPDPLARERLQELLRPVNKGSRACFELLTGLTLPEGARDTTQFVESLDTALPIHYPDPSTVRSLEPSGEKYYICTTHGFDEVRGIRVRNKWDFDLFAHKEGSVWRVTEGRSGLYFASAKRKDVLTCTVEEVIEQVGLEKFRSLVEDAVKRRGLSPLYTTPDNAPQAFEPVVPAPAPVLLLPAPPVAALLPAPVEEAPKAVHQVENPSPKDAHGPVPEKTFIDTTIQGAGWRIHFDPATQRTRVFVDSNASVAFRRAIEQAGFCWSPSMQSFNKKLTFRAFRAAQALAQSLRRLSA